MRESGVSGPSTSRSVTTVYLVRHGETEWNASGRCQGSADVSMSPTGRAQVERLAERLQSVRFDAAFTSPLTRARRTAEILLGASGLRPIEMRGLRELSYGVWQGLTPAEWPGDAAARWRTNPWSVSFPAGESLAVLGARVGGAIAGIVAVHSGESILVSGHGHANRLLILQALALDPRRFWGIEQPNGCAYRLDYGTSPDGGWVAERATLIASSGEENSISLRRVG